MMYVFRLFPIMKVCYEQSVKKIQIKQSGYVTSCIDAWKKSSLSCSLLPPMFLRNGFNVRLTSAHIIIGTDSVKSSLRRYWSSVSLKPPLLHASSPKTYEREREREREIQVNRRIPIKNSKSKASKINRLSRHFLRTSFQKVKEQKG